MKARNVFTVITKSGPIDTRGANAIMFINEGNTDFLVNGMVTVKPGSNFSISQVSADVIDETEYSVSFITSGPAPVYKCVLVRVGVSKSTC
jgi:hypothetical protein